MSKQNDKPMVMVSCETLMDLHLAAYEHDHVKYPVTAEYIKKAQEEARKALYSCGWWQQGDED